MSYVATATAKAGKLKMYVLQVRSHNMLPLLREMKLMSRDRIFFRATKVLT